MPNEKSDDFQRLLAEEMAKLIGPRGSAPSAPLTISEYHAIVLRVESAALEMAWRLLPPALDVAGAIAQRGAWVDHAEFLARYLRRRLGLIETPPLGSVP